MKMEKRDILLHDSGDYVNTSSSTKKITSLTYNVWCEDLYFEERMNYIVNIIKNSKPDVVGLVDANEACSDLISKSLGKYYSVFEVFTQNEDKSGCMLLCCKDTIELQKNTQPFYYDYPKGSRVIGADVVLKENLFKFSVLVTRLNDNPDNDHIREAQCGVLQQVTKDIKNYVMLGDFNFYSIDENGLTKLTASKDVWLEMNCPSRIKYTFDGLSNPMIKKKITVRNSRIYYASSQLEPKLLSLVGVDDIESIGEKRVKPSLYYGLEAVFLVS